MIPYIILVLFPYISYIINKNKDRIKKTLIVFFVILTVLVAFRNIEIGNDTRGYYAIFVRYSRMSFGEIVSSVREPVFGLITKAISLITNNYQIYLIIITLLTLIPIIHIYVTECRCYPILVIAIFITMSNFVMLFSGIRQSLAISLGLIAFLYVKKRKIVSYLVCVFIAFLIHNSSFMLLFMYPLYYARITKKWFLYIVPIFGIIFLFNKPIFNFLLLFISNIYEGMVLETNSYTMLVLMILFCIFSFVIPNENKLDEETIGMRNYLLLVTTVQVFAPLHPLAMRLGYYYSIFIPILIPNIIRCKSFRWRQVAKLSAYILTVFFIIYFFMHSPTSNSLHTFPYYFFWETVK